MKKKLKLSGLALLTLFILNKNYAQCSFTGLNPNYCINSPTSALTTTAVGGSFSGNGVIGSVFNPAIAGAGTHTITYGICTSSYAVTGGTGTVWFSPIPMPTVTTGPETPTSVALGDDQVTGSALPIGFNFQFFCTSYSTFYISSNGFITFSAGQPNGCCTGGSLPSATGPNNLITLSWEDFDPGSGGTITFATVGTAPNRILLVKFNAVPHFGAGGGPQTAQIQLYESTNVIEIHTTSMVTDGGGHTMGIQNASGTVAYVVTGRNSTTTWSASNEMYRFTPGSSCASTQTTIVSPSTITVVGNNSICVGSSASLTATGNTTYTWSTSSNANSISVNPTSNTTYSVSGTNSFGCVANAAITVTVDTTPTVSAVSSNGTSGTCPGKTVSLSGSGSTSYTWTGGITNGVAFSPTTTASYVVTGGNACGTSSASISVSIHPLPAVTAVASSASLCSGTNLTLTGVGTATAYAWFGGPLPITNGVGFQPSSTITYSVIGTSALSCTALSTVPVTVVTTPILAPTASPPLICIGKSSTLTATGATNYTWLPGSSNASSVVVSPTATSTYTLIKSNSNCVDTKTINVIVNQLPFVFAIVTPTIICASTQATLAGGGAQTYTWTTTGPPSLTLTGASPIISPANSSTYIVSASDGTCVGTTSVAIVTNPNPTINIVSSGSVICQNQSVNMTANGGINYTWTAAPSFTSNSPSITATPTAPTLYNVTADNAFGCTSSNSQIVLVNANPVFAPAASKTLVCVAGPSTLTAGPANNTYTWFPGSVISRTVIVNPTGTAIYTVIGTSTINGCETTKTVQVGVFIPTITVTSPTNTCFGGNITLVASGANSGSYNWNTGSGFNNPFQSIAVTPTVFTTYTVSAVSTLSFVNCPSTETTSIGIFYNPTVTAVAQRTFFCRGESLNLIGQGGVSYAWSNSATGTTITVNPTINTTYTVTGTDANGCVNTGTIQVKVSGCTGIQEASAAAQLEVYPNPNNGEFVIQSNTAIDLKLINELGQIVRVITLSGTNNHQVNVADLAKGIYFVVGDAAHSSIRQKIVVTK